MSNYATYCPEDNKLRLYIGRVPRDEYDKLRADGWQPLHKQRDAGQGDFAATWTPSRRATAIAYSNDGIIYDEDMGPDERAADRAERFSGYRDKRTGEAVGHADRYDSGPQAHGYQNEARAERAAARHDRIGDRATDAWDTGEYWQRRTAGVISHALHVSSPSVRMGRIKKLEAELRKCRASIEDRARHWRNMVKIRDMTDPDAQTKLAAKYLGSTHDYPDDYMHPRLDTVTNARLREHGTSLWTLLTMVESGYGTNDITGAEACALWFTRHTEPAEETEWTRHLTLRLAYEHQMLEAQGGRLAHVEIQKGGRIGGKLIMKVNKSSVTGRVTSVNLKGPKVQGWTYKAHNVPGTDYAVYQFDTERMAPNAYTPPTPESLAELEELTTKAKAAAPKAKTIPLVNPTDTDAERLQALWNDRERAKHEARNTYTSESAREVFSAQFEPATVTRITQATYSANSKGAYARAETRGVSADAELHDRETNMYSQSGTERRQRIGPAVVNLRITSGGKWSGGWSGTSIIVLTDKPQKPLPAAVWEPISKAAPPKPEPEPEPEPEPAPAPEPEPPACEQQAAESDPVQLALAGLR